MAHCLRLSNQEDHSNIFTQRDLQCTRHDDHFWPFRCASTYTMMKNAEIDVNTFHWSGWPLPDNARQWVQLVD